MGSSSWDYFAPYQPDIAAVVHSLRLQQSKEDIEQSQLMLQNMSPQDLQQRYHKRQKRRIEEGQAPYESVQNWLEDENSTTPEEYLAEIDQMGPDSDFGFHSILDMFFISSVPQDFSISPFPERHILNIFGTLKPTHDMVEAHKGDLQFLAGKWEGLYFIVYFNDSPHEWYVWGRSGD